MKSALLVLNFQNRYPSDAAQTSGSDWLGNVLRAMDAAARAGAPVMLIRQVAQSGPPSMIRRQNPLWGIHPEITRRNWDGLIDMCGRDIFAHPGLVAWLKKNSVETVTLSGHMADTCSEVAVGRAPQFGYALEVLSDAIKTSPYDADSTSAARPGKNMLANCLHVVTSEWVDRLAAWRRWSYLKEGVCF
jgi:nicotinamidase-related amidase